MTPNRHGSAVIELPNELDVVMTRKFDAPIALVFDVLTKAEHVSRWFAPFSCQATACSIDLRVGGMFRYVWRGPDGFEMGMRGTYLEITPPHRIVSTESFDQKWYEGECVETVMLGIADGLLLARKR